MNAPTEQLNMRLPLGLRERIKAKAEENRRSMTSEVVLILETAFPKKMEAGECFADSPASSSNNTALTSGASITPDERTV